MKKLYLLIIICLVSCSGNKSKLTRSDPFNKELKELFEADQRQRNELARTENPVNFNEFNFTDSLTLSNVIRLDNQNKIITPLDKYHAAWIYHHAGGSKMTADSTYFRKAYQLFGEVVKETADTNLSKKAEGMQKIAYSRWQASIGKEKREKLDFTQMSESEIRQKIRAKILSQVDTTNVNMDSLNFIIKTAENVLIKQIESIKAGVNK